MLKQDEIREIREIIEKANDPLYLFDDDGDGICSYLVLKNHFKKGRGRPVKQRGTIENFYLDYMEEGKPDLIVILDVHTLKQAFIDECPCLVLYIDHHPLQNIKNLKYFNPLKHSDGYYPTSELVYAITKDNIWIALLGCLFDYKVPDFINKFQKEYPNLLKKSSKDPGYIRFETKLGELVKVFSYNLKGKGGDVRKAVRYLEQIKTPEEIQNQTTEAAKFVYDKFQRLEKTYQKILEEAKKQADDEKVLLFYHPISNVSFVSELSTELAYWYPNKTIIIAKEKENGYKLSMRNQKSNIRDAFKKAIEGLNAYGGGHPNAIGGFVKESEFDIFLENFKKYLKQ